MSLLACLICTDASAAVHRFKPVSQRADVLVFKVDGLDAASVRKARLSIGRQTRPVGAARVREGVRRGRLEVKVARRRGPVTARVASTATTTLVVTTTCSSANSTYAKRIRETTGLISYWRLGERSGTAACDAAGRNSATYSSGVRLGEQGAVPDGDTSVSLSNATVRAASSTSLNPTRVVSAEAWVRPNATTSSQTILRKEGQYLLRAVGRKLVFRVWTNRRATEVETPAVLVGEAWQHVAATYDGQMLRVFHRGVRVARLAAAGTIATSGAALAIGSSGTYDFFAGRVDEVALYASVLSPLEILERSGGQSTPLPADDGDATATSPTDPTPTAPAPSAPEPTAPAPTDPAPAPIEPAPSEPAPAPTAACTEGTSWTNGFNGFGRSIWPGGCWRPYASTSPFNMPIPAGAPSWSGSAPVVDWFRAQGPGPLDWPLTGYNGYQATTYYGSATDPIYTIVRDPSTLSYGPSNIDGAQLHAPVGMKFNRDYDSLMSIIDQTTGTEYDFWYVSSIDDANRKITVKWGGKTAVGGDGIHGPDGYSFESGFGMSFGAIRYAELMAGEINHALYLCVPGVKGRVAPAINTGGNFANSSGMPPMGARIQVTLSDAEIEAVTLDGKPAPWYYKVILRAAKRYGMMVADEGDSPWGGLRTESGLPFEAMGQENPWKKFAREQTIPTQSGSFGTSPYLRFTALKDGTGQSVWRNIRVVAPSAHGHSDALASR